MREHIHLGPFDSLIRLPFHFGFELDNGLVETLHISSAHRSLKDGAGFAGAALEEGLFLASRVCCRSSIAHQVAFCQSIEDALEVEVEPEQAAFRVLLAELERIVEHLETFADIARCIEDNLMFSSVINYIQKIRAGFLGLSGNPFGFGIVVPGGVSINDDGTGRMQVYQLSRIFSSLVRDVGFWGRKLRFLKARFNWAGLATSSVPDEILPAPAFRASGLGDDLRCGDSAYSYYQNILVDAEKRDGGLTLDRLLVLLGEIKNSVKLIKKTFRFENSDFNQPSEQKIRSGKGIGFSEGPHGAIEYHVAVDSSGKIKECRLYTAAVDVVSVMPHAIKGTPYEHVITSLLSFSPCPFCLEC